MKTITILALAIALGGCVPEPTYDNDQCMRQKLFQQCMAALPEGPKSTQYNDWDEVVAECDRVAHRQSIRLVKNIAPACR